MQVNANYWPEVSARRSRSKRERGGGSRQQKHRQADKDIFVYLFLNYKGTERLSDSSIVRKSPGDSFVENNAKESYDIHCNNE